MIVYHFNRCSKSRTALNFLIEHQVAHTVIDYHKNQPPTEVIADLINRSNHQASEFVRFGKDLTLDKNDSSDNIIQFLSNNPKHLQRPIVDDGVNVVIARPLELLRDLPLFSHLFAND